MNDKGKQTYNPCDDCQYSYSKNNQESGMCKICELPYFIGRKKSEGEWISVDERLPDLYGTYLVYTFHHCIKFGYFSEWIIGEDPGFDDYAVTHWMPLPSAPDMKGGAE